MPNLSSLVHLFDKKCVALIGPSKCLIGQNLGKEIEEYDIVVRMNHQWPIPVERSFDLGKRMDVLYHCCNPDFSVLRFSIPEFKHTKLVCYESGIQAPIMRLLCSQYQVPLLDITTQYRELEQQLNTLPNTGLVAITHLLSLPITSLKLFGITFFRESYYEGYFGHGANSVHWTNNELPKKIWKHQLDIQYVYFLKKICQDPRLSIDSCTSKILF